jgi:hypothetical protein
MAESELPNPTPGQSPPAPTEELPPLKGSALDYLHQLLKDIATMLDYATETGVVLPESLRKKIAGLMNDPNVQESGVIFAKRTKQ